MNSRRKSNVSASRIDIESGELILVKVGKEDYPATEEDIKLVTDAIYSVTDVLQSDLTRNWIITHHGVEIVNLDDHKFWVKVGTKHRPPSEEDIDSVKNSLKKLLGKKQYKAFTVTDCRLTKREMEDSVS